MNTTVNVRVQDKNGTYKTNKILGMQASNTAGPEQAVQALARKLFPGRGVTIRSVSDYWTITPDPIFNTIEFVDCGQDFTEWVLRNGFVIDCQPFQSRIWLGCEVKMIDRAVFVRRAASDKFSLVRYPAKSVSDTDPMYVQGFEAFQEGVHETPERFRGKEQYQFGYNVAKALTE